MFLFNESIYNLINNTYNSNTFAAVTDLCNVLLQRGVRGFTQINADSFFSFYL